MNCRKWASNFRFPAWTGDTVRSERHKHSQERHLCKTDSAQNSPTSVLNRAAITTNRCRRGKMKAGERLKFKALGPTIQTALAQILSADPMHFAAVRTAVHAIRPGTRDASISATLRKMTQDGQVITEGLRNHQTYRKSL